MIQIQNSHREPHAPCKRTNKLGILCWGSFRNSLVALLIFLGIGPALYGLMVWEQGNFHVVSNGRAYRSRQLDRDELARYAHDYGLKSVLNLRGKNLGARWYQEEILAAQSLGLGHYDYALSANRDVGDHDIERILDVLREAPKPILIHERCGVGWTARPIGETRITWDRSRRCFATSDLLSLAGARGRTLPEMK